MTVQFTKERKGCSIEFQFAIRKALSFNEIDIKKTKKIPCCKAIDMTNCWNKLRVYLIIFMAEQPEEIYFLNHLPNVWCIDILLSF